MSQLHTCIGPVASNTGFARGVLDPRAVGTSGRALWSRMLAPIRHQDRRPASITPVSQVLAKL